MPSCSKSVVRWWAGMPGRCSAKVSGHPFEHQLAFDQVTGGAGLGPATIARSAG